MLIKRFKKISLVLLFFVLCSTSTLASNYGVANGVILNENKLNLDVKPIIVDGRTMVPVRAILESLEMKVTWDGANKTAIGEKEGDVLKVYTEEKLGVDGTYNGVPFHSEHAPTIIVGGRTLVSVRTISTLLGLDVKWDQVNKNVVLNEMPKPNISLKQAYNSLVENYESTKTEQDQDLDFVYFPFGGYASKNDSVANANYVFSVYSYSFDDYNIWDLNIIVNKHIGDIKSYEPLLGIEGTVPYRVKDYLTNGQEHLSNAEAFWWDETHLENLSDETINDLYRDFLKSGGNEYIIRDFAEYLSVNAPIYPDWKEVFESTFIPDYKEPIVKYKDYGNGFWGVYIEDRDTPYVYVNARTGYYRG